MKMYLLYRQTMNAVIVLGDPIGNEDKFSEVLTKFYDQMYF